LCVPAMGSGPAVAPGVRGSTGPWVSFLGGRGGSGWSAGGEGLQAGDRGGDLDRPGPGGGEAQPQAAAAADQAPGGGEQAEPQPFGFPGAGGRRGRASPSRRSVRRPWPRARTSPFIPAGDVARRENGGGLPADAEPGLEMRSRAPVWLWGLDLKGRALCLEHAGQIFGSRPGPPGSLPDVPGAGGGCGAARR
jgi:hypothetical protein